MLEKIEPIGVFDSGIGGLSVLKQLIRFLPFENYVYLGDTARVPYGNKSDTIVKQYAKDCTKFLLSKNVKLIVVACNTVSAVALNSVQKLAGEVSVIGMIQPAAAAAIHSTNNGRIGIIGTRATIQSDAYSKAINDLVSVQNRIGTRAHTYSKIKISDFDSIEDNDNSKDFVQVFSQECPLFVPLVEEGFLHHQATELIAKEYLQKLIAENIDTLVLGCTHYPMLSQLLRNIMPNVTQIDSGEHSAVAALRLLATRSLLSDESTYNTANHNIVRHNIKFYVTDYPNHFYELSKNLLGFGIDTPELISL
jgi:glutamate racemase